MTQLLLFPTWTDDMNLYTTGEVTMQTAEPPAPFQAHWLELRSPEAAKEFLERATKHNGWTRHGYHLSFRQSGRFVCKRRLPCGPVRKLSELDELGVGQSILWNPEATMADLKAGKAQAAALRAKERGEFRWELRDDASLWVARTAGPNDITGSARP